MLALLDAAVPASPDPLVSVGQQLFMHGPIGILCLVLMYAVWGLYKSKEKLVEEHRSEVQELVDRHIATVEKCSEKSNDLARNLKEVLESIMRNSGGKG